MSVYYPISYLYPDIGHFHGIKLITGSKELKLENSLIDSGVEKNSRVALVVTTYGGHLLKHKLFSSTHNVLYLLYKCVYI